MLNDTGKDYWAVTNVATNSIGELRSSIQNHTKKIHSMVRAALTECMYIP